MSRTDKEDKPSIIIRLLTVILLAGGLFAGGLYSAATQNAAFRLAKGFAETAMSVFTELDNILPGGSPVHFLQHARKPGNGVTINTLGDDGNLIAVSGFFDGDNQIRLLRRNGDIVRKWPLRFNDHFPDNAELGTDRPFSDWNTDIHGMILEPDGSVVFNYEYNGIVKLDKCGGVTWAKPLFTHHSIERSASGGFWVPGIQKIVPLSGDKPDDRYPPFTQVAGWQDYTDDLILHISDEGEVLSSVSLTGIIYQNHLQALLTANGMPINRGTRLNRELEHTNKIAELSPAMVSAFPGFEAGDLLLSLREHNLLMVVSPRDWKVKWYQTGPWQRQHDPDFDADGSISVFDNNAFRVSLGDMDRADPDAARTSRIVRMNPVTRDYWVPYGNRPGQEFLSVIRGKHETMPDGGFLITEFEGGRAFQVNADGQIVWEYINRYDEEFVAEITEAKSYPASYFSVTDWSCGQN